MSESNEERVREVMLEAFTAGWQAAQAIRITNPRVLAVIESCFELWLREEVDEVEVLGLPFRSRVEIPGPRGDDDWPLPRPTAWSEDTAAAESGRHRRTRGWTLSRLPSQRRSPDD